MIGLEDKTQWDEAKFQALVRLVRDSDRIVFFGGAGVSTESGIPDFRSQDGLYHLKWEDPPETILSADYFRKRPEAFYRFYREKVLNPMARPNVTHYKLAEWERVGKLLAVITQNIDGLHQLAGSKKVFELHGSVHRNRCTKCGKRYNVEIVAASQGVPHCRCGGIIKPEVTLYGEPLNDGVMAQALYAVSQADLLIVGGTSLRVYPAAGVVDFYSGRHLVLINRDETALDARCELVLHTRLGKVFSRF